MNDDLQRFKKIVAQAGDMTGVNFWRHGLKELIADAGGNPSRAELAALAACYFCREDEDYNGFEPGLMATIQFLCETMSSFPTERQQEDITKKLIQLLSSGASRAQLTQWFG